MHQEFIAKRREDSQNFWSRLSEGCLSAAVLFLAWLTVVMSVRPIESTLGEPGLLVYMLVLLALSMFSLQQGLVLKHREANRAWYGVTGGFLAWAVVEVCNYLGVPILPDPASFVLIIMMALIIALLWRNGLSAGARFFFLTFLLSWAQKLLVIIQEGLASLMPSFSLAFRTTGILAVVAAVLLLGWVLIKTRHRMQLIYGSLGIWFLFSLALYFLYGIPY